jgi:hypothetical protein
VLGTEKVEGVLSENVVDVYATPLTVSVALAPAPTVKVAGVVPVASRQVVQ